MTRRSGSADLPLHGGRVPPWLAERMASLGAIESDRDSPELAISPGVARLVRERILAGELCLDFSVDAGELIDILGKERPSTRLLGEAPQNELRVLRASRLR